MKRIKTIKPLTRIIYISPYFTQTGIVTGLKCLLFAPSPRVQGGMGGRCTHVSSPSQRLRLQCACMSVTCCQQDYNSSLHSLCLHSPAASPELTQPLHCLLLTVQRLLMHWGGKIIIKSDLINLKKICSQW